MQKNIIPSIRTISYYIMASLFFMGNLKFFKMILAYLGVESGITAIAVGMFAVILAILIVYYLSHSFKQKDWKGLLLFVVISAVYAIPYIVHGMLYKLFQYCMFIVPFAITAYLLARDPQGCKTFFSCISKLSRIAIFPFILYIIILFVCEPGEYGIIMIKEMSYGDIALAALPFLFADLSSFFCENKKPNIFTGIRILIYLATLIYTGTRSIILCMALIFVVQIFLHLKKIFAMSLLKKVVSACAFILIITFCLTITPTGARLNVIKDNVTHELGGEGLDQIFDEYPEQETETAQNTVYCIEAGKRMPLPKAFEYYIVNNDCTISETQELLRKDIENKEGKYLIVDSEYEEIARSYKLPMNNRVYLWSTAWNEFKNSPIWGNGILYYQQKYEITYPHNVVFEILCDYGIAGALVFFAAALYLFISCTRTAIKEKNYEMGQVLALIVVYIPMHLLYHSLYFNGILFFTFSILLFFKMKTAKKKSNQI